MEEKFTHDIPLVTGIIAGSLFLLLLIGDFLVTMRNRKIIRRYSEIAESSDSHKAPFNFTDLILNTPRAIQGDPEYIQKPKTQYIMANTIHLKRAYDPEEASDGFRIYVDRLWPRGLSHETFHYDLWEKQISPSTELREWFHIDPDHLWPQFVEKYKTELESNPAFATLKQIVAGHPVVTILYSSHDREHNNAVVVAEMLKS